MDVINEKQAQGHWLLAKMGKKVLRPGGKELTLKLINGLDINSSDDVVEFAPGLGFTAGITLKKNPKSYTGIELNKSVSSSLQKEINGANYRIINKNANDTGLENSAASKLYGEAMLTMQSDKQKTEIVKEAYRILKVGGLYGIHEIALIGDPDESTIKAIYNDMAHTVKTNVKPLSVQSWEELLLSEGFKIKEILFSPMHLVEPKRIIDDEGIIRSIRIFFNILTHPKAAARIKNMKKIFRKYSNNITAIAIIAEKI